jgi:hypothetical protein
LNFTKAGGDEGYSQLYFLGTKYVNNLSKAEIAQLRLVSQMLSMTHSSRPENIVRALGAVQSQDYQSSLWAVGLRSGVSRATVEEGITSREIVRTWLLRGTLHLVASADARWILGLIAPALLKAAVGRLRQFEVDAKTIARSAKILERALAGDRQLPRDAAMKLLEANRIPTARGRGFHILWALAVQKTVSLASRVRNQHTLVLFDDWMPKQRELTRDEALAELAKRYFSSHGPATIKDFAWWSGLPIKAAREAHASIERSLESCRAGDAIYSMAPRSLSGAEPEISSFLLPGYDEYLLGYADRSAVLDPRHTAKVITNNGIFRPTTVINAAITGTWRPVSVRSTIEIRYQPFTHGARETRTIFEGNAERYRRFLGLRVQNQNS